jgi:hypothetical protein
VRIKLASSAKYLLFFIAAIATVIGCREDNSISKEALTIERLRFVVSVEIAQPHVDAVMNNLIVKNSLSDDQEAQLLSLEEAVRNGTNKNAAAMLFEFYAVVNFDVDYLSYSETIAKSLEKSYTFNRNDLVVVLWEKVYQRVETLRAENRNGHAEVLPYIGPTIANCAGTYQGAANNAYDGLIAGAKPGSTDRMLYKAMKDAYFAECFNCCSSNCGTPEKLLL